MKRPGKRKYPLKRPGGIRQAGLRGGRRRFQARKSPYYGFFNALFIVMGTCFVFLSMGEARVLVRTLDMFNVRNIEVSGCLYLSDEIVRSIVEEYRGVNGFALDRNEVAEKVAVRERIRDVSVKFRPPGTLKVELDEREPVAYLTGGEIAQVDSTGRILPSVPDHPLPGLPVITGVARPFGATGKEEDPPAALAKALSLLALFRKLNPLGLYQRISEIDVRAPDNIVIYTVTPVIRIYFGSAGFREKIEQFGLVWMDLSEKGRVPRTIDLRYEDHVIVTMD